MTRPVRKHPLPSTNPHGVPVPWGCYGCGAQTAAYQGRTPKGWRVQGQRRLCPKCAGGGR